MYLLRMEDALDQHIYNEGIYLDDNFEMPAFEDGIYYNADDMPYPIIAINKNLKNTYQRNYVKAHELGHHYNCICNLFEAPVWIRQKYEVLADRYWIEKIMSVDRLIAAYKSGVRSPFELVEYLQIPLESIMKGFETWYQKEGPVTYRGQYCIYWNPFDIKRDRRRRK